MNALTEFLLEHPVEHERRQVVVSKRLREHPFTVTAASAQQMEQYLSRCRRGRGGERVFDGEQFNLLLVLEHCVEPDFHDLALIEAAGCHTPTELVNHVLKAGEIAALARAVYRLSGYDQNMAELVEEVKN